MRFAALLSCSLLCLMSSCTVPQATLTEGMDFSKPEPAGSTVESAAAPAESSAPEERSSEAASGKQIFSASETGSAAEERTGSSVSASGTSSSAASLPETSAPSIQPEPSKPQTGRAVPNPQNTAYLTFDDGPTTLTPHVLDILKQEGVRATFFVVCRQDPKLEAVMKRAYEEGHEIAVHSATHDYKRIYASSQAFLEDFQTTQQWIRRVTGDPAPVTQFRFPGGSSISKKLAAPGVLNQILQQMEEMGAAHHDWNVSAGDASKTVPTKEQLLESIIPEALKYNEPVILMHDTARNAHLCEALPEIISALRQEGYAFDTVSRIHNPVRHRIYGSDGQLHIGGGYLKRVR